MFFSAAFVSTLLLLQGSFTAALTVDEVVTNINAVTDVFTDLRDAISPLSVQSDVREVQEITLKTLELFEAIIQDLSGDVPAMESTSPFDETGGSALVGIQQDVLSDLISKHDIVAQMGPPPSYAVGLRALNKGLDDFTRALMDLIPTEKSTVQGEQAALDSFMSAAIDKYE